VAGDQPQKDDDRDRHAKQPQASGAHQENAFLKIVMPFPAVVGQGTTGAASGSRA
jgi:hypothetical protein